MYKKGTILRGEGLKTR